MIQILLELQIIILAVMIFNTYFSIKTFIADEEREKREDDEYR